MADKTVNLLVIPVITAAPYEQARLISEAGLTAIIVPKQFGGLGIVFQPWSMW